MPGKIPNVIQVFRIVHIDNMEYLMRHGMFTRDNGNADPNYINIGDPELIINRSVYRVKIDPPNGLLGEYVPFYFGPLSPMLLRIRDGYGVTKRPQEDIIYVVCKVKDVISKCKNWCFTDGHAKKEITEFYNHTDDFYKIDWNMVNERYWRDNEDDFDRMRRKQAEFLVKDHVPVSCIGAIVVYNNKAKGVVENIMDDLGLTIPIRVNRNFYY